MGQTTDQIARHISNTRHELDDNIHELRHKVKGAVNWRVQAQERPWTMMGLAFGVGLLASVLIRNRGASKVDRNGRSERWNRESEYSSEPDKETSKIWSNVKAAVAAVVVAAAKDFVEQIIPGFREQYRKRRSDEGPLLSRSA